MRNSTAEAPPRRVRPHTRTTRMALWPRQLEATRTKLDRLVQYARSHRRALVLTHDNPDPDSMAAGVALAYLLEKLAGVEAQVAYGGIVGRAENRALLRVLKLPVVPLSRVVFDDYDLICMVGVDPQLDASYRVPLNAHETTLTLRYRKNDFTVVEAPFGSHPGEMCYRYHRDEGMIKAWVKAFADPLETRAYLERYIYGVKNHQEYLDLVGREHLDRLREGADDEQPCGIIPSPTIPPSC